MKKDLILKVILSVLLFATVIISIIMANISNKEPVKESIKESIKEPIEESIKESIEEAINNPINVYLFWGNGCPHCENAKQYFDSIKKEYNKYFEFIEYEVWYNEENNSLYEKVQKELNATGSGVPFILIGDKYFRGYSSSLNQKIIDTILEKYEDENYMDIVEKTKLN